MELLEPLELTGVAISAISVSAYVAGYEPEGRQFESVWAHHPFQLFPGFFSSRENLPVDDLEDAREPCGCSRHKSGDSPPLEITNGRKGR
jgi:hypothetical protein